MPLALIGARLTVEPARLADGGVELLQLYRYDTADPGCSAANTSGKLADQYDSFGRSTFSYDSSGQVVDVQRVRRGADGGNCSGTWSHDTPNTHFTYLADGRLSSETYLHGREVRYTYGDGGNALPSQVLGISIVYAGAPREIVRNASYDATGALRSYEIVGATGSTATVAYSRGASESSLSGCSSTTGTNDQTGRMRSISVTRPGGSSDAFRKFYRWSGHQLTEEATCLLGQSLGTTKYGGGLLKGYDDMSRLEYATRPTGESIGATGGSFGKRQYSYARDGNRVSDVSDCWTFLSTYDSSPRWDRLLSRTVSANSCSTLYPGTIYGAGYEYDWDGRVSEKWVPQALSNGPNHRLSFNWTVDGSSAATGSVLKTVTLRKAGANSPVLGTYQYFYDAAGRRREKRYPLGQSDEFYWSGTKLLEDRGLANQEIATPTSYPIDEYIWLAGVPVAMVKSKFDSSWTRTGDSATADCTRNQHAAKCGVYFVVADYIGKPVAMFDDSFRVTGIGEYDPFGQSNRVLYPADSPREPTTKNHLSGKNTILAYLNQPILTGVATFVRPRFASVDTDSGGATKAFMTRFDESAFGADDFSGPNAGPRVGDWQNLGTDGRFRIRWKSAATNPNGRKGVIFEGYDFWRVEAPSGLPVERVWTPLRFPGHYYDAETDLFENWNRFYDPSIGRYLSPDPILLYPEEVVAAAASGMAYSAYSYAGNNPIAFADPDGRLVILTADKDASDEFKAKLEKALEQYKKSNPDAYNAMNDSSFIFEFEAVKAIASDGSGAESVARMDASVLKVQFSETGAAKSQHSLAFHVAHENYHQFSNMNSSSRLGGVARRMGIQPRHSQQWRNEMRADRYGSRMTGEGLTTKDEAVWEFHFRRQNRGGPTPIFAVER